MPFERILPPRVYHVGSSELLRQSPAACIDELLMNGRWDGDPFAGNVSERVIRERLPELYPGVIDVAFSFCL